ncbi:hypothetical protein RB653_002148 [Dictyostelium firmibasis]|uniref:Uncharacterized protein n=1 Tax=Dictyostelium firmibasis TaxID=79012 RepID=A0AAN7TX94_9MYCE
MKLYCKFFTIILIILLTNSFDYFLQPQIFVYGESKKFDCGGIVCPKLKCKENEILYRWKATPIKSEMCCPVCKINCDLVECNDENCENGTFSILNELGCCSTCVNDCSIYECPPVECPNGSAPIKKETSCCLECL